MVMASGRWLGVRLDLLASMLIGAVSLAAVLVSQDAGRCIYKVNQNRPKNDTKFEDLSLQNNACPIRNRAYQYFLYHSAIYLLFSSRCITGTYQGYHCGLN